MTRKNSDKKNSVGENRRDFLLKDMRIYSLDVLRGIAIAIMLFLDAPPDKIYSILQHAEWEGMTVPDIAFPMFAFAMGAGAAISMSKRPFTTKRILKRTAALFALGLLLNMGAENVRLFGVLQRLALTYAFGIFIVRAIKNDVGIFIAAIMLLTLSSLGYHIYAPENPFAEAHNISRAIDYIFPGAEHIYTPTHDPEGLYGAIAGTASVLFGYLAGKTLIRREIFLMVELGLVLLIAGGIWSEVDIIAKKLWTTPFALINAGGDFLLLALLTKLGTKKFLQPFDALGRNPLFFFFANNLVLMFLTMEGGIYFWLYEHTTAEIISVEFGATLFCALWCMLWFPIAELFKRFNVVIKI